MRKVLAPLAPLVGLALVLAACSSGSSPDSGQGNGRFVYDTNTTVMQDWDPASAYATEIGPLNNMYETLTRYDAATKKLNPDLATRWTSSSGGTTWTFVLRAGVSFHSGRAVSSTAVKESVLRTKSIGKGAAYIWSSVQTIDTPSPTTVVFHLKTPAPLDLLSSAGYAAFIYDTHASGSADLGKWFAEGHDAGSGPYTVQSWAQGQEDELTLKSFPKYWGGWTGPHYTQVVFRVVRQDSTAAQLARSGQVDFVEQISPQLFSSFQHDASVNTLSTPSWQNMLLFFNTSHGPLTDVRVRQGLANAIDYGGVIAALDGAAQRQAGLIPKGLLGHFDDIPQYTHDVAKAKTLLNAAGYGPGKAQLKLSLTITQGYTSEQLAASLLKSDLAQVNVDLSVQSLQTPTKLARARSSDPSKRQDMTMLVWYPDFNDPNSWFQSLIHSESPPNFGFAYYSNKQLDHQIDRVGTLEATNRAQAEELYRQMQDEIYQQVPVIALWTITNQRVIAKSVEGFTENPAYPEVVFFYQLHPKT
jgi:peptide/nickel transport system substrate-binding protein